MAYAKPGKGLLKLNGETRISKQGSQQQHNGVCSSKPGMQNVQPAAGLQTDISDVQYHVRQLLGRMLHQQCRRCTHLRDQYCCAVVLAGSSVDAVIH